ncbi:MAG: NADH:ubiquinone oxidoreductase subunit NDUFA12 [Robiginitomaculum sp.]|nr:MAG: NADH:ubiquinone oxidoreductase subunit NDUFA12 [Robiginitomaculum sp.]
MLLFIKRLFAWWDGATLGTLLTIAKHGRKVGEDEFGNIYYEEKKPGIYNQKRRWVTYKGYADGSRVPTEWHGWMHHTFDAPPTEAPLPRKAWEKDHQPNLTGTIYAWHPKGALANNGHRPHATGDYEAWTPDEAKS